MKRWVKNLNSKISNISETRWGSSALFLIAIFGAFMPLPMTTIFLIMVFLNTEKTLSYVILIVGGTLIGALGGFFLGHFAWLGADGEFTAIAQFFFNYIPGFSVQNYDKIHALFDKWDFWLVSGATVIPLPLEIFTISSGIFDVNIVIFLISIFVSQGLKYSIIAFFAVKLTDKVREKIRLIWKPVAILSSLSLIAIVLIIKIL
jgi:membrane protein YqaA with SNARE-associated domain